MKISNSDTFNPSDLQIEQLIIAIGRCSTPDNSQPWQMEWIRSSILQIRHLPEVDAHIMNIKHLATHISLGGMIEAAKLWALKNGYELSDRIFFSGEEFQNSPLRVELHFSKTEPGHTQTMSSVSTKDPLAEIHFDLLFHRKVERRAFSKTRNKFNPSALIALSELRFHDLKLHFFMPTKSLIRFISEVEVLLWKNQQFRLDLFKWFRFRKNTYDRLKNGLYRKELGVPWPEVIGLALISRIPRFFGYISFLFQLGFKLNVLRGMKNIAGMASISVSSDLPTTGVRVGALGLRLWLELQRQGFAVQPFALSVFSIYYYCQNYPHYFSDQKKLKDLVKKQSQQILNELALPPGFYPVWWLRYGECKLDPIGLSKRNYRINKRPNQ